MAPNLLIGDIQQAFLQVGLKPEDRDAFRFVFELIDGTEERFRFTRIPFGAEASPFLLGATLQHHYDNQPQENHTDTLLILTENTYVDNLMKTGDSVEELKEFKHEATTIMEEGKFPVHKWESNVHSLESADMPDPGKILGLTWHKQDDVLEIQVPERDNGQRIAKKSILSHLAGIYDPLGIISPTVVEGKHIYREACDENQNWDSEVPAVLAKDWLKWTRQLRNVRIPRSVIRECRKVKAVHLHLFADASNLACSAMTIAIVEHDTGTVKGFLTSKSRICKTHLTLDQLIAVVMDIERHLNNRPLAYIESDRGEPQVLTPNTILWGDDSHILEDREQHEIKGDGQLPKVGEIVLVLGEEKNCGLWKKGKVLRLILGKDGVVRGVVLRHKGHEIERPIQLVCPLEIRSSEVEEPKAPTPEVEEKQERPPRRAAEKAKERVRHWLADED
ncbi:Hypothetical predicted protein [Paramuricea clavata]|uniref:DUF5641 domain-containing protein n=1 Tax=Paramuricea clavata TaxID=317549 RepID=A0A7D9HQY5_PARCT|nr:Hypothetical predicted protein [Paramuricea clavata]